LKGRDLAERLRATDARPFYEQAVAKDPGFAMAWVGMANTSGTTREFVEAVTKAASLAAKVSDGERHIILGLESGLKNDRAGVLRHYTDLVAQFPNDERAQTLLANTYFGRQEYQQAVEHFVKATQIDASFSQPYNQLGYAYRFLEKYGEAEAAFKRYVELIPGDPNPYDSYGELLMKMGRFDESIAMYKKALAIDPNVVASYIGIGNDQLFKGQPAEARQTFAKIAAVARNTGEKRTARFWTAAAYVHEGATDKAVAEIEANMLRQQQELEGLIALEEKRYADAIQAFKKSNRQDPRILYFTALALKGAGDANGAAAMASKAANFNQLSFNLGYVRAKAMTLVGPSH
jgi:tetratricopeptide (TPR) repeat protein